MPNLVETYAKYKGKNFEIVGVSLDQDGAAWKEASLSICYFTASAILA